MNRAVKCRIEPNKEQIRMLEKTFGCCRFLYNRMLSDRMDGDVIGEPIRPRPAMYKTEFPWLKSANKKSSTF
jgi:putative transposase